MGKRLWDLAKSRFEIATILLGHRYIVTCLSGAVRVCCQAFRPGLSPPYNCVEREKL